MEEPTARSHRIACLKLTLFLLSVWAFVSFGCSILLRSWMDGNLPSVGSVPFGFWMAQQGYILCFVLLLVVYAVCMRRLDNKHGYTEE